MFPVIAPLDLFMIGGEITYHYSISRMAKPPEPSFVQSSALDNHYQYFNIKKKKSHYSLFQYRIRFIAESGCITESNLIETALPAIFHIVAAHCGCHIFLCGFLTVDELFFYPHDGGDTTSFNLSNASDRITFP